jgi:hypothetical protein
MAIFQQSAVLKFPIRYNPRAVELSVQIVRFVDHEPQPGKVHRQL